MAQFKFKNNLWGIRLKGVSTARHSLSARLLHWVLAPSFLLLAASGFYMHNPSRNKIFKSMNAARKTHFISQNFFVLYLVIRAYTTLVSKDYRQLYPGAEDLAATPGFFSYEFFLRQKKPLYPKYNPGQKMLFVALTLLFFWQTVSGVALYSTRRLQKISLLFGGLGRTRLAHYLGSVGLLGVVAAHLYFAFTDSMGKLKAIITGYFKPK